jgi:putative hydrolase
VRALDVARATPIEELEARHRANTLTDLPGIGDSTARVIEEALDGEVPAYLVKLETETVLPMSDSAAAIRARLRGDCHSHSLWSDGGASIDRMARTASGLGHDYLVLTDHSPRLTVAHGLNRQRLEDQLIEIDALNEELAPFRILTGMEVDINEDGSLDLDDDLLARLDVVVASVHSKLRMERQSMTERMVRAVASPHVDILGHCTGRLIEKRPQSVFDADYVFAACAQFGTAVEINSRPERLDPPPELLPVAIDHGCVFTIDTDAHATGQLEWQAHGCEIAAGGGVPVERIMNTLDRDSLLAWTSDR